MFKFLPGIILVQVITIGLTITAFNWSDDGQLVLVICLFAFVVSILTSFWFSSIGRDMHKDMLARIHENYTLEKEQLLINTEREKAVIVNESFKLRDGEIRRAYAKANFKVGVVVTLAAIAGTALIFAQFVTVGLTTLIASGSALLGYLTRAKQERISQKAKSRQLEKRIEKQSSRNLLQSK